MPEENKAETVVNANTMAGPSRSAETARALIRKTKRATRRHPATEQSACRWRSWAARARDPGAADGQAGTPLAVVF